MNCASASGRITGGWLAEQRAEQALVAEQVPVADVVLADVGVRRTSHHVRLRRVIEQLAYRRSEGVKVARVWQQDAGAGRNLVDDSADRGPDDGTALPHALSHGQAEALGEALLHDHAGMPLQRVDHHRVLV